VIVSVFTFGGSFLLYKITSALINVRVLPEYENMGLDLSQHSEKASDLHDDFKSSQRFSGNEKAVKTEEQLPILQ
jgi:ammonia channel protein AmtB